jgi:ComEC/Rec2-related protein
MISVNNCDFSIPDSTYLFDSEKYYKSQRIFLTADNVEIESVTLRDTHKLERMISTYRENMILRFKRKLGTERGSFLAGVIFGDSSEIESTSKSLLYRSGIGHIMAVSGLHISIIVSVLMAILKKAGAGKYLSFGIMNIFLVLMIIMTEIPVSAVRSAIMMNALYSAGLFRRQNDSFNSLAAAVLIMCICNPYVIYSSGFVLSVSGTFGIAVFSPYMTAKMKRDTFLQRIFADITAALCTSIVLMPFCVFYFDETSVISPLTNVFLFPFCFAAILSGILYVFTGGIVSMLSVAGLCTDVIMKSSDFIGKLEFTYFSCGDTRISVSASICTVAVIIITVLFFRRKYTAIAISCAVVIFATSIFTFRISERNKLKIAILGKGVNAAAVISYKGRTSVVDLSGNYKSPEYVRKYLISNGISDVNLLAITGNVQSEYIAYMSSLELTETENIILSENLIGVADNNAELIQTGDSFETEDVFDLSYSDGVLEIEKDGFRAVILPTGTDVQGNADISVFYGSIKKDMQIDTTGYNIYLDETEESDYSGINNFEIIIPENGGECRIRRL